MIPLAVALVVEKGAAAAVLRDAWQLAPTLFDALALALVTLLSLAHARAAHVVGAVLGLYIVANAGLVAAVGSPLSVSMLAYAGDTARAPLPRGPLAVGLGCVAALVVGALLLRNARPLAARAIASIGALALVAVPLALARGSWGARDNPLSAFALSLAAPLPSADAARVPFDEPLDDAPTHSRTPAPAPDDVALRTPPLDASGGRPRHVVLWLAESVGARHTSLVEGGPLSTPALARLRHDGALSFTSWAANTPVSAKAIFATLCGLYPLPEATFEARAFPRIACPSLMETLTARGWRAALFHGGYFAFTDKLALLEERGFEVLMDGENVPDRDRWFTNGWGVDDAALVEHGLAWLDRARAAASESGEGAPTLAVYIPLVPHYEYWLPPGAAKPFGNATLQARYRNGIAYTDALFGRVVEGYRARGLMEDTLFVFIGDHGEAFDEHPKNKLHAAALYEENVHVPALFIAPRLFAPRAGGSVSGRPASHVDLVPTVLDLVGVPAPAGLQGQSLVSDAWEPRPVMLSTFYPDALFGLRATTREHDWKYIRRAQDGAEELYDLALDPGERTNVVAHFPDEARALRGRVLDYTERQRAVLKGWPTLGTSFLDRALAALRVDGAAARGRVEIVREKSFNMERRCLKVRPPAEGTLVLTTKTTPPARLVGIGLTDRARFAKGEPVRARFVAGGETVALEVNDVFETTSKVRALAAPTEELRIEIDAAAGKDRSVCLTLAP